MGKILEKFHKKIDKKEGIYAHLEGNYVDKLLQRLTVKQGNLKNLSAVLNRDESSLRRWRRNHIIPFPLVHREYINKVKFLSVPSSPHKITIPDLTEEIAYLIGYISGDGHLKNPVKSGKWETIIESWTDVGELKRINKILTKNFNIKGSITKNKTRKGWRLFINSKIFHRILTKIFEIPTGKKSEKIRVPKIIKKSSNSVIKGYIRSWFDAEGFVTKSHNRIQIEFQIKNIKVTKWIKHQLKKFGIKANLKKNNTIVVYSGEIENFCSVIGFRNGKQLKKLCYLHGKR